MTPGRAPAVGAPRSVSTRNVTAPGYPRPADTLPAPGRPSRRKSLRKPRTAGTLTSRYIGPIHRSDVAGTGHPGSPQRAGAPRVRTEEAFGRGPGPAVRCV